MLHVVNINMIVTLRDVEDSALNVSSMAMWLLQGEVSQGTLYTSPPVRVAYITKTTNHICLSRQQNDPGEAPRCAVHIGVPAILKHKKGVPWHHIELQPVRATCG